MRPADEAKRCAARTRRRTTLALRPIVLALLGALALAASAHAAEPVGEQPAAAGSPSPSGEEASATGTAPGAPETTEKETGVAPPSPEATQEQTPSGAGTEVAQEQPAPESQSTTPEQPAAEQPAGQPTSEAPPEAQAPAPVEPTPEPPVVQPVEHAPEPPPAEPPPSLTLTEQTVETQTSGAGSEQTSKDSQPPSAAGSATSDGAPAGAITTTGPPPVAIDPIAQVTGAPSEVATEPPIVDHVTGGGAAAAVAAKSAAFGSGPLSCALLDSKISGVCPELVSVQSQLTASPLELSASATSLGADAGDSSTGGERERSAVATPPIGSAPEPQPSGAAGGAAAGGGGIAMSGFPTLAGLLHLAAPRAMRRLRLLCRPWRTACFALIPERPG